MWPAQSGWFNGHLKGGNTFTWTRLIGPNDGLSVPATLCISGPRSHHGNCRNMITFGPKLLTSKILSVSHIVAGHMNGTFTLDEPYNQCNRVLWRYWYEHCAHGPASYALPKPRFPGSEPVSWILAQGTGEVGRIMSFFGIQESWQLGICISSGCGLSLINYSWKPLLCEFERFKSLERFSFLFP
jgi:hypothetical protein